MPNYQSAVRVPMSETMLLGWVRRKEEGKNKAVNTRLAALVSRQLAILSMRPPSHKEKGALTRPGPMV